MALAMETPVSISAPSAAIIIEADKIPGKFNSGCAEYKNIFSSPANPDNRASNIVISESPPAKIRLSAVPIIAEELFEFNPPTR